MKLMKKLASVCLVMLFMFSLCIPVSAQEVVKTENNESGEYNIYSEEYPNAYIVTNSVTTRGNSTAALNATVFVEETYALENDEIVVKESKLLSEQEVKEIGIDKFEENNIAKIDKSDFARTPVKTNRGKLTISIEVLYHANISGGFQWSGFDFIYSGQNNPAVGSDYMGITWSGGYQPNYTNAWVWYQLGDSEAPIYLSDAVPNAGRVWEFNEYYGGNYKLYLAEGAASVRLNKTDSDAGKEVAFKYIHTYESAGGSISISASSGGIGAGFSLSNVSKQWSLVVTKPI